MPFEDWRPRTTPEILELRARLLSRTRDFFRRRGVLEVETPLLGAATATDPHIESIRSSVGGETRFLQTSPELFMKRLLAAGSGPIYQITRAFRDGEAGSRHNPEFTILEWYRPGFDHHQLMDEVEELLRELFLAPERSIRETYGEAFEARVGLDPHRATAEELARKAKELGLPLVTGGGALSREDWLALLMAEAVEHHLGKGRPHFLYDFPLELKALARLRDGVAERFELFLEGIELGNGYHELTDPVEQRERFRSDLERRRALGRPEVPIDERMLEALDHGLPPSAGVALGFDRLVMIAARARSIGSVMAFPATIGPS